MIGRALPREIERDFEAEAFGGLPEPREFLEAPETGIDRRVASVLRPDRPRRAGIAGSGDEGIIPPLAERPPDRMNRRQVHHVEAEVGDRGEAAGCVGEGAATSRIGAGRAREHFIPRAEPGTFAVYPHAARLRDRFTGTIGV